MGLIGDLLTLLFGGGRNVLVETLGAVRENAEPGAERDAKSRSEALSQFSAEFAQPRRSLFDRVIDGLNRLPRPLLAFGTLGLFISAMVNPIWFASRMQGIALVPEPLWWLMGAIVSFYFGARSQAKGQEFQRSIAETAIRASEVTARLKALDALNSGAAAIEADPTENVALADNPALEEWSAAHER